MLFYKEMCIHCYRFKKEILSAFFSRSSCNAYFEKNATTSAFLLFARICQYLAEFGENKRFANRADLLAPSSLFE